MSLATTSTYMTKKPVPSASFFSTVHLCAEQLDLKFTDNWNFPQPKFEEIYSPKAYPLDASACVLDFHLPRTQDPDTYNLFDICNTPELKCKMLRLYYFYISFSEKRRYKFLSSQREQKFTKYIRTIILFSTYFSPFYFDWKNIECL
jgi:hypothetical protein